MEHMHKSEHLPIDVPEPTERCCYEELLAEITKCEVVCANCHRIRTRRRPAATFGKSWSAGR